METNKYKNPHGSYIKVYDFILNNMNLSALATLIYAYIFRYTEQGSCFFGSQQYLADKFHTSRQTINTILCELVEKGYVAKEDISTDKGKCCKYIALIYPDGTDK